MFRQLFLTFFHIDMWCVFIAVIEPFDIQLLLQSSWLNCFVYIPCDCFIVRRTPFNLFGEKNTNTSSEFFRKLYVMNSIKAATASNCSPFSLNHWWSYYNSENYQYNDSKMHGPLSLRMLFNQRQLLYRNWRYLPFSNCATQFENFYSNCLNTCSALFQWRSLHIAAILCHLV